ncbi:MAG TPA: coproporphyrinogen dehydrogenase HemZ [Mogibacterium sp.]|nr:coproporphyrinogen dehydrogenase HemZ [Mogibacterium sp.]
MIRVFIKDENFEAISIDADIFKYLYLRGNSFLINTSGSSEMDVVQRELYNLLTEITGKSAEWGIMTGVRPLKIAFNVYKETSSFNLMRNILKEKYLLSDKKISLLTQIIKYQIKYINKSKKNTVSVYIGIPFCPTLCEYCSFASSVAEDNYLEQYIKNLLNEISYMGQLMRENRASIESLYIGGGTPTVLSLNQIKRLLEAVKNSMEIDIDKIEFTVEAGRPDTITSEKLQYMRDYGVSRISINPQTMKDDTLKKIGRKHTSDEIKKAYNLVLQYGYKVINADIIAGLPDESFEDFVNTLNEVLTLGANNITVHTLSVKKGSKLKENNPDFFRRNSEIVNKMLDYSRNRLVSEGFYPYYIYRQKHQIGFLENVGYCKPGTHSLYNVRIMEEMQTIIGLGAGAVGKIYYPDEDRIERVPNVSNHIVYNKRIDEIIQRKNKYYGG